jgi:hypothetical protein
MFKFNFAQVLDYPVDEDDTQMEALSENLGEIVITPEKEELDRVPKSLTGGALPTPSDTSTENKGIQDCEEVELEDIVCYATFISRTVGDTNTLL